MLYLSQLIGKKIYYQGKQFGKILDMAIFLNKTVPPVSKIEVLHGKRKITLPPQAIHFENSTIVLTTTNIPHLPYDHKDLYLAEDLLDKQVIDVDGRRLVRVNDVVLENGHELKVAGIDIGIDGILRRLGLGIIKTEQKILPWSVIEAFDYDTGTIKIKLKHNALSKLHPADIADILEDAGMKERLGIVESLDAKQAARAIEEADEETQLSILESLSPTILKEVINKMHISEIADVFHDLNPLRLAEIQKVLGKDKLQKVKLLSSFSDTVAGGLMHETFTQKGENETIGEVLKDLKRKTFIPEVIVVTKEGTYIGTVQVKDMILKETHATVSESISDTQSLTEQTPFDEIVELFAQYNLRVIPVIDLGGKPLGIVSVDEVLKVIDEENERDESL